MEDAGERRKRLQALREKAASKATANASTTNSKPTLKFRNYRPNDTSIKEKLENSSAAGGTEGSTEKADSKDYGRKRRKDEGHGEGVDADAQQKQRAPPESLIQQELKKQKETQDEEELNIAPKKVNWDLKRDVEKKLDKLNRRTQRAIVEIIRQRMAEEAARGSGSNSSSDGEEGGSSSGSGSGSESGDESDGGAGSGREDGDGSSGSSDGE